MIPLILTICANMNAFSTPKLDCNVVVAVAKVESSLNPKAVGISHGEIGLFQLRPEFHNCAVFDPANNTRCAIHHLKYLKRRHGKCFISYYNLGSSFRGNPCKTKYIIKVLNQKNR